MSLLSVLRWIIRIAGVLGLTFWSGGGLALLGLHQTLGYIVSLSLLVMAIAAFRERVSPTLLVTAVIWSLVVPGIGSSQLQILPGNQHWVIQVFHLLLGVGAIGLAEVIAGRAARRGASAG